MELMNLTELDIDQLLHMILTIGKETVRKLERARSNQEIAEALDVEDRTLEAVRVEIEARLTAARRARRVHIAPAP